MAPKAFPALLLLVCFCGELVIHGHAEAPYAGGSIMGGHPAGMQPSPYTTHRHSTIGGDHGGRRLSGEEEEEKAFMIHSLPAAHDRPLPVPPSAS
ncbi:hypothetical protein BRADI_3g54776v3 [Brachypodium distachyon]|uniref:Uncharacterized protein n=1 Tax=Brachypodium distachyon TaxID=15368 RepID=A0A0Q3MAB5_BRADI|nr:hypothetical protein BRADI_3g54776v3 [Brachypodium distachyon]